jgi:hypothetical protein
MSPVKQTKFFSLDYEKGLDFYFKTYFSGINNQKASGEATPTYFLLPFVIDRIKNYKPDIKLVFCLRHPVERAYSGWSMRINNGTENLPFRDALQENLKQRESFSFVGEEGAKQWHEDQRRNTRQDDAGFRTYIEGSLYAYNLNNYYENFDSSQIKIIFLDSLKNDLYGTLKEIYAFLGVDKDFIIPNVEQKNTHKKSKIKFLDPIFGKNKKISKIVSNLVPKSLKKKILDKMYVEGSKSTLSVEDRKFAYEIFRNDISQLEEMLQKNLSHWKV